ncbi:MAG TPA: hypothetical protein PKI81_08870, partial [bacterium]|nr:hypothetical protein [bacterium]
MYTHSKISSLLRLGLLIMVFACTVRAQKAPELETALIKVNRVWTGVTANGAKASFDYRAGFFPNDFDIIGVRGQEQDLWAGAGFKLATTNWRDPIDSLHTVAVYGPTNDFMPNGKVTERISSYVRHSYTAQEIDFKPVSLDLFATHDPSRFGDLTCDQIVQVTTENILGVQVKRRIMAWSQTFNDDYLILDVEFTNTGGDTLTDFYISVESNGANSYRSNGTRPAPGSGENFNTVTTWQHYYGGRTGDSLRVFYEYSADDPSVPGDLMGAPVTSQNGRLINPGFVWYSVLHASEKPYTDPAGDTDDFLQPKVTYMGTATKFPYNSDGDEYGDKNFWALRGAYSEFFPMSGNTWPGTFHAGNIDEQGNPSYAAHPAGTIQANNSKMYCTFGPYHFNPGEKLHLAFASGFSGLDIKTAKEVGAKWKNGTLEEPPGIPNPRTGFLPDNFAFPVDASEMDMRKDRWVSTGVDSVMKSAWRAQWNFDHGYRIPAAPPPAESVTITGLGTGVEIRWSAPEAESRADFAGYRIMRRLSNLDTLFFEEIYTSGPEDKAAEHLYVDKEVLIGAQYYYYVQSRARIAADDPLADPLSRGRIIYSSRVMQPTINWINPPHFSQNDLTRIRIVPNPYNINDPLLVKQGWTDQRGIQFYNLPGKVTIKIFTEFGDLVQTIEHDSPVSAGYEIWDMITRNQQVISSGVYIVVFQKPTGETAFQKFMVV